jgi:hypothetical protein
VNEYYFFDVTCGVALHNRSYPFKFLTSPRPLLVSQAILPCIHVDREIIAVMVLTKGINKARDGEKLRI